MSAYQKTHPLLILKPAAGVFQLSGQLTLQMVDVVKGDLQLMDLLQILSVLSAKARPV